MITLQARWFAALGVALFFSLVLACHTALGEEPGTPTTNAESSAAAAAAPAPGAPAGVNKDLNSMSVALDTIWVMVAGFLVMWMQAGFALVETGLTRAKNAVNICMKNLLDYCFGSLAFWLVGFGLMFSIGDGFVGKSGFMLQETPAQVEQPDGTMKDTTNFDALSWTAVPLEAKFFFQLVFAATAATIVSGAMAERTKFVSYMVYSIIISLVIYPISGHWIWGGGWLAQRGFFDFAGSTVVHSVGGWLSLVGAFVLGPRIGKYDANGKAKAIPGHNLVIVALGVFILWLGWFGFNPGSTMGANAMDIAHITLTTNAAGATGAIVALFVAKAMFKKWEATMALNGALAGLVSVTAPCMWISIPSAIIVGAVGGALVVLAVVFVEHKLKIDDPVGAISVHGVCGAWGTLCVGLFAMGTVEGGPKAGLFAGGNAEQLIIQATGIGAVFVWCMATGLICFYGIKLIMGLRVSPEEEKEGLDYGEHGNEAYHGFQFHHDAV